MKLGSTAIMRCSVVIAGIVMFAICGVIAWITFTEGKSATEYHVDYVLIIFITGTYMAAIPYFIALHQTFKLLDYIDTGRAFTELSVKALKAITYCAIADFIICMVGGAPFFSILGRSDGNPGMAFLGLIPSGVAFVIVMFTSVLKRLLSDAIVAKSENDLTI
ncbi:MAG: DUF2975 domain-containing protein [Oscillospiraceae bacterium]|jgi:hypothetical protein|nr:DUF2975 domain-containing protein [Oscillospiraceae bacterium]